MSFEDPQQIPHLIIKKVNRASQKHMEEFVRGVGNVDTVYFSKTDNDYPYMFVIFKKESSLYKTYAIINEKFGALYEVSLKPLIPKKPLYCLECLKESYYFCENCSAPFCGEPCQKKHWPKHAASCAQIPRLVQMQWKDYEPQIIQYSLDIGERVAIVGYQSNFGSFVTVRSLEEKKDKAYQEFIKRCNEDAEKSPAANSLGKDTKVWVRIDGQWFRAKVDQVTSQSVTVVVVDLGQKLETTKDNLRLLQSKELFLAPDFTREYRLKSMKSKDVFTMPAVRARIETAIRKVEPFTVVDNLNNYIDLQLEGQPKSFNIHLLSLFDRQVGVEDEPETDIPEVQVITSSAGEQQMTVTTFMQDKITFPEHDHETVNPRIWVFSAVVDGLNSVLYAVDMKWLPAIKRLMTQVKEVGEQLFKNHPPPSDFEQIPANTLLLYRTGEGTWERCAYKGDHVLESVDSGHVYEGEEKVKLEMVRFLPRELISQSYLMVLLIDDDDFVDKAAMQERIREMKNVLPPETVSKLVHLEGNNFNCILKENL